MNTRQELLQLCAYIAECEKWICECPLTSNGASDALFETYGNCMEQPMEECRELAEQYPDEAIRESILGFIDEGEYGEHENSFEAWLFVCGMISGTPE